MADVTIKGHPQLDPGWVAELVASAAALGLSAEEEPPDFLGKGAWELVMVLLALPAETWLVERLLDAAMETVRPRPAQRGRLKRIVVRDVDGNELGSVELDYEDDDERPGIESPDQP
jgi:hypothetical protein